NARPRSIDADAREHRTEMLGMRRVVIMNADELQTIDLNFFLVENPNPGAPDGVKISRGIAESLMISEHEIFSQRRRKRSPRFGKAIERSCGAIVKISGQENKIGP